MGKFEFYLNGERVIVTPDNWGEMREEIYKEKMQRISEDINVRYANAFKALAKSERQDRENEILFGFERNLHESRR